MNVQDLIVTERPGERTKAKPDAVRVSTNRDYAADLIRRLVEQLADENKGEVKFTLMGEVI